MAVKASCTVTLSCYRDTQSVTRYYKLQSSTASAPSKPTANPPSGWTDSEPSYTSGSTNTLYFCDLTVFSDGTWSYSTVSKSSSYEAAKEAYNKAQNAQNSVDNLEIGGRNYVTKRTDASESLNGIAIERIGDTFHIYGTNTKTDANYGIDVDWIYREGILDPGATYTLSLTKPLSTGLYLGLNTRDASGTSISAGDASYFYGDGSKTTITFTVRDDSNGFANGFFGIQKTCGTVDCTFKIKLEKGNRATDWTPAPEDIEQTLQNTETNIRQTISEKSSDIIKETESILLKALESYTETSDFNTFKSTMENQLQVLSDRTTLQFTQTTQELKKVNDDLQTKFNTITKYFTFNVNGLVIGQVDNPYKVIIDNDRYSMTVNDVEVMWIADGKVYTPEMEVTKALKIFDYLLDKDGSENVNCSYVGGES